MSLSSAAFFFSWFFPFSDLSDLVTTLVARASGNQVFVQFETLDISLVPVPAVSAKNISVETPNFPEIEAKKMTFSPSLMSLFTNLWTIKKAASGDPDAASHLGTRMGANVSAEDLLGAEWDLRVRPGTPSDKGSDRSKISLAITDLNLNEVQKWASLTLKMQGRATVSTNMQFTPGFLEPPEADMDLHVTKFNLPASNLMLPYEGAMIPMNLPTLSLAEATLRGHLVGGKLYVDEGVFGRKNDPLSGRIKGQMDLRLIAMGTTVQPQFGAYNLTVELNTTKAVEKDIGFAFLLFDSAKTPTSTGSHYLFQASGAGFGPPPAITRVNTF